MCLGRRLHFSCQCGYRGALEKPPGTLPRGACLLLSLPGRRGCGRWWAGSQVQGSCELFFSSPRRPFLLLASPALAGPHVLGTPGPGLPITRRDPTMAAAVKVFLWALVSNTGPGGERRWGGRRLSRVSRRPRGAGRWELAQSPSVYSVCIRLVCLPSLPLFLFI